jgi:hypothetical protein
MLLARRRLRARRRDPFRVSMRRGSVVRELSHSPQRTAVHALARALQSSCARPAHLVALSPERRNAPCADRQQCAI